MDARVPDTADWTGGAAASPILRRVAGWEWVLLTAFTLVCLTVLGVQG